METTYIINLISTTSFTLFAIAPTVFVFSVTLLGTAIEQSQQEEKAARENDKINLQSEIDEIEKSLKQAKKDGKTEILTDKLGGLKKKQSESEERINDIKIKYNSINLTNSVLYPCASLLLVILSSPFVVFYQDQLLCISAIIFFEVILIIYSVIKIYRSLILVQQISANKKESENYSKLKDNIKLALQEYDQSKKEEMEIKFTGKVFPLNVNVSTELTINFKVGLKKGSILNDTNVWFFIPDGFGLIKPTEKDSWKQSSEYTPPNIRTIKVSIGDVSIGPFHPASIVIKTPETAGKYTLKYQIHAKGYEGPSQELRLLVG